MTKFNFSANVTDILKLNSLFAGSGKSEVKSDLKFPWKNIIPNKKIMNFKSKISSYKNRHLKGVEKLVFLDLCHWFDLLENEKYKELRELCIQRVNEGKLIFPVNFSIINEFQKHKDKNLVLSRLLFADKISKRLSVHHYRRLLMREFFQYSNNRRDLSKYDVLTHWFDLFPAEICVEQNGITNKEYEIFMEQLLSSSPAEWLVNDDFLSSTLRAYEMLYADVTVIYSKRGADSNSRNKIRNEELDSEIDHFLTELLCEDNLTAEELSAIQKFGLTTKKTPEARREFFRNLPSLYMRSEINTSLRYDRDKIKVNDLWDLEHAISLPYTDFYVTDKPSAHILKNTLKLESKFEVSIFSSLEQLEKEIKGC